MQYLFEFLAIFNLAFWRYLSEFLLVIVVFKWVGGVFSSKHRSWLAWFSYRVKSKLLIKMFAGGIEHHQLYITTKKILEFKKYTRYVRNKTYKVFLGSIVKAVFWSFESQIRFFMVATIGDIIAYNKTELVHLMQKEIVCLRVDHTYQIRKLIQGELIDLKFGNKYLVWIDVLYVNLEQRVKDLKRCRSSYEVLIEYLYIVNDMLDIYIDQIPGIINTINGEVKSGNKDNDRSENTKSV